MFRIVILSMILAVMLMGCPKGDQGEPEATPTVQSESNSNG